MFKQWRATNQLITSMMAVSWAVHMPVQIVSLKVPRQENMRKKMTNNNNKMMNKKKKKQVKNTQTNLIVQFDKTSMNKTSDKSNKIQTFFIRTMKQ
jgi:hypothetical protein